MTGDRDRGAAGPDAGCERTSTAARDASGESRVLGATRLSSRQIYEAIRRDGVDELYRPVASLVWSGIAAGQLMSLSVLGEAVLRLHLHGVPGAHLVESFGYCIGFLAVIFGRMQLFTENTIATVLPLMTRPRRSNLTRVLRLWSVVLSANVVGAGAAAGFVALGLWFDSALVGEVRAIALDAMAHGPVEAFLRAVPAGVVVAAIVWMLPSAAGNAFFLVVAFTWFISAAGFAHIVVGSVEAGFLLITGELGPVAALGRFFVPVLLGNVVGGTAIFALLAWGQVRNEVPRPPMRPGDRAKEGDADADGAARRGAGGTTPPVAR